MRHAEMFTGWIGWTMRRTKHHCTDNLLNAIDNCVEIKCEMPRHREPRMTEKAHTHNHPHTHECWREINDAKRCSSGKKFSPKINNKFAEHKYENHLTLSTLRPCNKIERRRRRYRWRHLYGCCRHRNALQLLPLLFDCENEWACWLGGDRARAWSTKAAKGKGEMPAEFLFPQSIDTKECLKWRNADIEWESL